tara:strand:+ start:16446 stop:17384 length:939 start_codon:yes stop_codon:yes gene_type:complete
MVKGEIRKAQASVLTIVLIILIVIILAAVLWNILVPLIRDEGEKVSFGQFSVNLEVTDVIMFEHGVLSVSVNRGVGEAELDGLKFVFTDAEGNAVTRDREEIGELETKTYSFSAITGIGKVEKVDVAPIINNELGMPTQSEIGSVLEVPYGVVSWWRFDENGNDFVGGNTCLLIDDYDYDCGVDGLNLNNFSISFWMLERDDGIIIETNNYKIILEDKKIKFEDLVSGEDRGNLVSDEEIKEEWNHVLISVSTILKIYVNNRVKAINFAGFDNSDNSDLTSFQIDKEIKDVMFFNKPISSENVEGLYKNQLR